MKGLDQADDELSLALSPLAVVGLKDVPSLPPEGQVSVHVGVGTERVHVALEGERLPLVADTDVDDVAAAAIVRRHGQLGGGQVMGERGGPGIARLDGQAGRRRGAGLGQVVGE